MKEESYNLIDIEEGKTYILTKKEDYYAVMGLLSMIVFTIGLFIGSLS